MKLAIKKGDHGFALVITLITIVLLTIMAVAFLTSSSLDQTTARAVANKSKAELAARAAVNTAIARMVDNITTYPDSSTAWETINGNIGTELYYRDKAPDQGGASIFVLPLASGAVAKPVAGKTGTLPALDDTNSYDLNHARYVNDPQGWIGAPISAAARPAYRGQWVNQTDSDNSVTSRFAYWVEDESFKANVNLLGVTPRGSTTAGDLPTQIPLQGLFKALFPTSDFNTTANTIFNARASFPSSHFFEYRALDQVNTSPIADSSKFEATIYSGALNMSRSGSKRINLNKVVTTSTDTIEIRKQLDEIVSTINFHLPNFGQRFYRSGTDKNSLDVTATDRIIYNNKVAANIRDYIDTDSQPTIINNDPPSYTVRLGTPPTHCLVASGGGTAGANEVIAIGKERVPMIQEYAIRIGQIVFSAKTGASANYTVNIDNYVEVWNESNADIPLTSLGPNPFLLIANQPGWDAGGLTDIPAGPTRDLKLLLSTATRASDGAALTVFPAGSVTVLTTDTTPILSLTPFFAQTYKLPVAAALRTYSGTTQKKSGNNLRLNMIDRTTTSSDYETEIAIGNDLGILESAWGGGAIISSISVNVDDGSAPTGAGSQKFDVTKYHFRGSSLKGNIVTSPSPTPAATTGDPRTNAEQLRFDLNGGTTANDKTRYFGSGLSDNAIPGPSPATNSYSSLGAADSNYVAPNKWPDYSSSNQTSADAPEVIANTALVSIGQLGDIFDPVRVLGDSGDINLSRSGGRTLRVGQTNRYDATTNPLGLWDGNSTSASRDWTAWRLTDIFTTSDLVQFDGRINVNGVVRDGGAALKAVLYGYIFQDPQLGSAALGDPAIQKLVDQLTARVKNDGATYTEFGSTTGPISERGEVSEMPIFTTGTDLTGLNMNTVYDRGREELLRRLIELTTTRGNIFTVYAVGQSLSPGAPPIVSATTQFKVTFRIDPIWDAGTPADPFTPTNTTGDPRFKKPDRYAIKILYAGE